MPALLIFAGAFAPAPSQPRRGLDTGLLVAEVLHGRFPALLT